MFIPDMINAMWGARQVWKSERNNVICKRFKIERLKYQIKVKFDATKSKIKDLKKRLKYAFETKEARATRLAKEEEERKQQLKEANQKLAFLLMLKAIHDGTDFTEVCDFCKTNGVIEDYE